MPDESQPLDLSLPVSPEIGGSGSTGECPSCGRFIGPYERCPYCGADVGQRMVVRAFRYGSLVLAILGLALLVWVAGRSQVPKVTIGSLSGTMNWAYVYIEGVVTRQPSYDSETKSLKFWVGDGESEIMAVAYHPEAEWLMAEGLVPVMGDAVALEGTLRINEDFQTLVLDVPQRVEIQEAKAAEVSIAEAGAGSLYQRVTVRGVIREDRVPYSGLRILNLRDSTGEIDVTIPSGSLLLGGEFPDLGVGQSVQVTGAVDQYRGDAQISLGRASEILVLDEAIAIAPLRRIAELATEPGESMATVEGVISKIMPFSSGVKLTLEDATGAVTLLLWQSVYDTLVERDALVAGATVRVQGDVAEYRGDLEIVPALPSDLTILVAAERIVTTRHLGELGVDDVGQAVEVEGILRSVQAFSAGVKGVLDDGTGTVVLLLWQDIYDRLADPADLVVGARVMVRGEVSEYQGALEIVPRMPSDVIVTGMEQVAVISPTVVPEATAQPALTPAPSVAPPPSPSVTAVAASTEPPVAMPTAEPTGQPTAQPTSQPTVSPAPAYETRSIGTITSEDVGSTFAISRATIADVSYFSSGVKYTLADDSGTIILLLWQNVVEGVHDRYDLFPGSQVQVLGAIDEFQGDLEIIPKNGADLALLARGERPSIEERVASNVTPADEGRIFIVEGEVVRTESDGWFKLWLRDGTGEILIFVPGRAVDYLPPGIAAGKRLRVKGEVDIYQGVIEIIPLAAADIEVR